jgi:hypothetical protein
MISLPLRSPLLTAALPMGPMSAAPSVANRQSAATPRKMAMCTVP